MSGNSSYSSSDYVITATVVPNTPTSPGTFVSTSTPSDVWVYWSHSGSNENGFTIERSTDNMNFATIGTSARNTGFYSDVAPGTGTYYYRVAAYNAIGNSGYSSSVSAIVP